MEVWGRSVLEESPQAQNEPGVVTLPASFEVDETAPLHEPALITGPVARAKLARKWTQIELLGFSNSRKMSETGGK